MKQRRWASIVVCYLLGLIFMAFLTFLPEQSDPEKREQDAKSKRKRRKQKPPSSWEQFKSLLSCKQMEASKVHDPSKNTGPYSKLGSSCSAICSFKDVAHGNTRVVHRADNSPNSTSVSQEARLLSRRGENRPSAQSGRGMQLRRLSGCYECRMVVDPSRYPVSRNSICACPQCGEVFPKIESLELHQILRHAVSELGPEDAGLNIVEIIFKSSWMKKDSSVCKIERILKVHNIQKTIQRFEECRDTVKTRALNSTRKNPRCAADGNELLRFHCTTLSCALGTRGSTSLCGSIPGCGVCNIIRHGFQGKGEIKGVRTMASSGRAHDALRCGEGGRAMLVCRVIAGRVKRIADDAPAEDDSMSSGSGSYDAIAGSPGPGLYSNLEDLIVFNPRAILPCFVVIYKAMQS